MNAEIEKKLDNIYDTIMDKPNQVLNIFNSFFGEDKVDMQGFPSIEEFKNWIMNEARIGSIAPSDSAIYTEDFNYLDYRYTRLSSVSEEKCIEVLNFASTTSIANIICNGGFILIHFPHVRITNEYDRYVDINHLYAKVPILTDGTMNGRFSLNRSEYPILHLINDYMHSHVPSIPIDNFEIFICPCLGSGPINGTILNLQREFDSSIWELFCLELSKYVEVESIEGVPYHRLETLGASTSSNNISTPEQFTVYNKNPYRVPIPIDMVKRFTEYFIKQNKLKFNYINGSYSISISFIDYMIIISNVFIDWYNDLYNKGVYTITLDRLLSSHVLWKGIIKNKKIFIESNHQRAVNYLQYRGKKICKFKGEDVLLTITDFTDDNEENSNLVTFINIPVAFYILNKILYIINYKYGKPEQTDSEGNRVSEKVKYL